MRQLLLRGRFWRHTRACPRLARACGCLSYFSFCFATGTALSLLELSNATFTTVKAIVMLGEEDSWPAFRAGSQFSDNLPAFGGENLVYLVFSSSFRHDYHA